MPIDMKGWKVVYKDQVYIALCVEPIFTRDNRDETGIQRPAVLRVSCIDHYAQFMVIEEHVNYFKFIKEDG